MDDMSTVCHRMIQLKLNTSALPITTKDQWKMLCTQLCAICKAMVIIDACTEL